MPDVSKPWSPLFPWPQCLSLWAVGPQVGLCPIGPPYKPFVGVHSEYLTLCCGVFNIINHLFWCVQVQTWAQSLVYTLEELECKICYNRYDTRSRKPKLLGCLHRVCAKCLKKMVDMGEFTCQVKIIDTNQTRDLNSSQAPKRGGLET